MIQNISQEWFNELDAATTESIDYQYIIDFIKTNRDKAILHNEKIHKSLQSGIQRVNKINTSSTQVIELDKKLSALIEKMNDSMLFDIKLEHNILSFLKQVELSKEITDFIEKCYVLVNSSSSYLE